MMGTMKPIERGEARRALALGAVVTLGLLASACTATDRSGGELPPADVTLELASVVDGTPNQISAYIDAVEELSDGTVHITVTPDWGIESGKGYGEQATLDGVAKGEVDMAWVGTRAFDDLGGNAFPAFHAPLLIDSYDLQREVFDAGIPQQMLADLEIDGIRPLAVLPGPLRKVVGVEHPFVAPADFEGATLPYEGWDTGDAVFDTLGIVAGSHAMAQQDISGLDGAVAQLSSVTGNNYQNVASHLSSNLNLYPRALAVVIGTDVFDALDPRQQRALEEAAEQALAPAFEYAVLEDAESGPIICRSSMQVDTLTDTQLNDLEVALGGVLEGIATDPHSADVFAEIVTLKERVGASPEGIVCTDDEVASPSHAPGVLDGTAWTVTFTMDELAAADLYDRGELHKGNVGTFTLEFGSDGTFIWRSWEGPEQLLFTLNEGVITMDRENGERFDCRWSVLDDKFSLMRDEEIGVCPTLFLVKPWTRMP